MRMDLSTPILHNEGHFSSREARKLVSQTPSDRICLQNCRHKETSHAQRHKAVASSTRFNAAVGFNEARVPETTNVGGRTRTESRFFS